MLFKDLRVLKESKVLKEFRVLKEFKGHKVSRVLLEHRVQ
jgi:hypothetical protein